MIYFLVTKDEAHVKIGTARDVERRREALARSHPTDDALRCVFMMRGGYRVEHALHLRFDHLCTRGEWFRYDEEIKRWIAKASSRDLSAGPTFDGRPWPSSLCGYQLKMCGEGVTEFSFSLEVPPCTSKRLLMPVMDIDEVFVRGCDSNGDPCIGKVSLSAGSFAPRRLTIQPHAGLEVDEIRCGSFVHAIGDELPKYATGCAVAWSPIVGDQDSIEFTVRNSSDQRLASVVKFSGLYRKDVFAWKP